MVAGAGKADLYGEDGGNGAGDVGESIASLPVAHEINQ